MQRLLKGLRRWWLDRRRQPIADARWQKALDELPFLRHRPPEDIARLKYLAERFLHDKDLVGAGGLSLDERMRTLIAAQACLPILHLGLSWYRGWYSVIVYPDDFVAPYEYTDEAGVVHEGERELAGEAWPDGPVVLSWSAVPAPLTADGHGNLVIHEFAHKLDLLNGDANGMPPLHPWMSRRTWEDAFSAAWTDLCARVDRGDEWLPLDEYAAEDPGEFFAVASEWFFTAPQAVRHHYPDVYRQLHAFYRPAPPAQA